MDINFGFIDNHNCTLNDKTFPDQCCCKCVYRKKVIAHCLHVAHNPSHECNCGDEMGFYVCSVFDEQDNTGNVSICGTHGLCECFTKREETKL